jgi:hypothetical protein
MDVWRESNVLRVPNAALRFRPTHEIFEAFGESPPDAVRLAVVTGSVAPSAVRATPTTLAAHRSNGPSVDQYFQNAAPIETTGQVYVMETAA